jgi:hypothetical protein
MLFLLELRQSILHIINVCPSVCGNAFGARAHQAGRQAGGLVGWLAGGNSGRMAWRQTGLYAMNSFYFEMVNEKVY